jgi:hypothetical protein
MQKYCSSLTDRALKPERHTVDLESDLIQVPFVTDAEQPVAAH